MQSIRTYPVYSSFTGDALFPGMNHESRVLNSAIGEVIATMRAGGAELTHQTVVDHLESFIPVHVAESGAASVCRQHWQGVQRVKLLGALQDYFLDGGQFQRWFAQRSLIAELDGAGGEVVGVGALLEQLDQIGDWQNGFVNCIAQGRVRGISLRRKGGDAIGDDSIGKSMGARGLLIPKSSRCSPKSSKHGSA